jgi:UDP:flavonoid glycosyltransferase YjiC (YdhE family)
MPLSHVLAASDLLVSHGGQGTTLTALHAGVPQLVLPQFDDHFDNADAVVKAGAGLRLLPDEITPGLVARHCLDLLQAPEYGRAAADVAAEIAAEPSAVEVVGVLAECARPRTAARRKLRRWAAGDHLSQLAKAA